MKKIAIILLSLFFALSVFALYVDDVGPSDPGQDRFIDQDDPRQHEPGRFIDEVSYTPQVNSINYVFPTLQNIDLIGDENILIETDPLNSRINFSFIGDPRDINADINVLSTIKTWGKIYTTAGTYPEPDAYYWDLNLISSDGSITITGDATNDKIDMVTNLDFNDTNIFYSGVADCPANQYVYGFNSNGTIDCRAESGGNVQDGNADGQMLYWDKTLSEWVNSDLTELYFETGADILFMGLSSLPFMDLTTKMALYNAQVGSTSLTILSNATGSSILKLWDTTGTGATITNNSNTDDLSITALDKINYTSEEEQTIETTGTDKSVTIKTNTTATSGAIQNLVFDRDTTGTANEDFGTGVQFKNGGNVYADIFGVRGNTSSDGRIYFNLRQDGGGIRTAGIDGNESSMSVSNEGSSGLAFNEAVFHAHADTANLGKPIGKFHQDNTAGGVANINLDQDDEDEPYIDFDGSNVRAQPEPVDWLRIEYNGTDYAIAIYNLEYKHQND